MTELAPTLEAFFTERLMARRQASPHTVASYRDAFRLLLKYVHETAGTQPARLCIEDLDAPLIGSFLDRLAQERRASISTRKAGLAAIHSLYRFAGSATPSMPASSQRACHSVRTGRQAHRQLSNSVAAPDPLDVHCSAGPGRFCSSSSRRACGCLSSRSCDVGIRRSELEPMCASWGRSASNAPPPATSMGRWRARGEEASAPCPTWGSLLCPAAQGRS